MECHQCGKEMGASEGSQAITSEGIVWLCRECFRRTEAPVFHKPANVESREVVEQANVYERLSRLAGVNPTEHRRKFHPEEQQKRAAAREQNTNLRALVDKQYDERMKKHAPSSEAKKDFVTNFHWILMRMRRKQKLTQDQLAQKLGEPVSAIKLAEQGVLPSDHYALIRKFEAFFRVKLLRDEVRALLPAQPKALFDGVSANTLTVGDLRDMKAACDTEDMVEEFEEEETLNVGFGERLRRMFSRKPKVEIEETDVNLSEALEELEGK